MQRQSTTTIQVDLENSFVLNSLKWAISQEGRSLTVSLTRSSLLECMYYCSECVCERERERECVNV